MHLIAMPRHVLPQGGFLTKTLLIMKLTAMLLLAACLQVSAKGDAQQISLSEINAPLKKVFDEVRQQTGFLFFYDAKELKNSRPVSILVKNASLLEILDLCFKDQPLTYTIVNRTVVVKKREEEKQSSPLPSVEITGTVTNQKGEPLAGVTVYIKGTKKGSTTDEQGNFKITIPGDENSILEFSFVGYQTQSLPVNKQTTFRIVMKEAISDLNEIVIVGYGTQKKENLTGSVATVSSKELDSRPLVNLGDGLEGLVPNLNVNINNGQPGTGSTFNIRGFTTVGLGSSSSPLILVDGVARDPNLIDPNDVASVTILKDASSSAIYGSRAAYGVILITTKTGRKGPARLSYTGSYTTSKPTNVPKYINSGDYLNLFNSAQATGELSGGYTSSSPFTAEDSIMAAAYRQDPAHNPDAYPDPGNPTEYRYVGNTDWIKVLYPGWAPMQQHNLSLSGGEGKTSYVASMGYFRQEGLEKVAHQVYERYTPSLKLNTEVNKWLTTNLSLSLTHTGNNQGAYTLQNQGGSWIPGDLRPLMPVYNPDGNFSGQGSYTNPVAVLTNSGRDISNVNDFWATGKIILKPVDHVTITSDYTWNAYSLFDKANLIPFNEYGVNGTFLDVFPWTNPSQVTESSQNNNYYAFNAYGNYENTFIGKHYFKALIGYNQEYNHYRVGSSVARNLIDPNLPAIGANNDPKPTVSGVETESALVGTFLRLNYIYEGKYLVEFNGRYDGTSRFPEDHRYAWSPSVSAGWNIAKESFMEGLRRTVRELKLRGSYGQLPNQLTPPGTISSAAQYPYIATQPIGTVGYLFNNEPGVTVSAPGLVSSTFTWEKVQTKNIGIDYVLLKDRLSGSFDYFITDTKDMVVYSQQLPAVLGTSAPPSNSANLRTKGWELHMTWKDQLLDNKLSYSVTLGLSDNSSTITKYSGNPTYSLGDYYPGEKLGNIWGYVTNGFYKTDAEAATVDNSALAGYTWLAGDIKYADLNKDGKIGPGANTLTSPGDQKIIGNNTPRYKFGLSLSLAYKGFDFATFVQGVLKQDFEPSQSDYVFYGFASNEWNLPYAYATNHWTATNTNAYFARPRFDGVGNEQSQTKFLLHASYARVKQLTLGYSLPQSWVTKGKIQKVRVYMTGSNLFTITSMFKGYDPELITYNTPTALNASPYNYRTYPINKSVSFGVQITL
jgi:TonB-linked SusC/RagA family outer membrane protein